MDTRINITLNGEARELDPGTSLMQLAEQLGLAGQKFAIEVNQEIIPRSEHLHCVINAGDQIEIVQAIGGG